MFKALFHLYRISDYSYIFVNTSEHASFGPLAARISSSTLCHWCNVGARRSQDEALARVIDRDAAPGPSRKAMSGLPEEEDIDHDDLLCYFGPQVPSARRL